MAKRAKRRRTGRIKSFAPLMELPGIRQKSGSRHTIHNTGSNICYTPYIVCNIPPNPAHICKLISIACLCRQFAHFWGSQLVASAICKLHLRLYFILPTKIHCKKVKSSTFSNPILKILWEEVRLSCSNTPFYTLAESILLSVRSLQPIEGDVFDPIKYICS